MRDRDEEPRHTRLLDLIVEGVPSPAKAGSITHIDGADTAAFVFKTIADPFAGRINLFRVLQGAVKPDQTLVDARTHAKERMGSLLFQQGKEHIPAQEFGPGDIGAVAKLKEVQTGDLLLDKEVVATDIPEIGFPEPVMSFAVTPGRRATRRRSRARSVGSPRRIRPCACGATSRPGRRSCPG